MRMEMRIGAPSLGSRPTRDRHFVQEAAKEIGLGEDLHQGERSVALHSETGKDGAAIQTQQALGILNANAEGPAGQPAPEQARPAEPNPAPFQGDAKDHAGYHAVNEAQAAQPDGHRTADADAGHQIDLVNSLQKL